MIETVKKSTPYKQYHQRMGSEQIRPIIDTCKNCKNQLYCQCKHCYKCYPIQDCQNCIKINKRVNIEIDTNIEYSLMKDIYDKGLIKQIQCFKSDYLLKVAHLLHHVILQIYVEFQGKKQGLTLDFDKNNGLIKIILNRNTYGNPIKISQIIPQHFIEIQEFKKLFRYILQNWQGRKYDRYKNNCYNFMDDILSYLCPKIQDSIRQKIKDQKIVAFSYYSD